MGKIDSTTGELLFSLLMASVASVFAAVAGLIGVVIVCRLMYSREQSSWAPLAFGPPIALILGGTAFILVFRWFESYGNPKQSDTDNESD